MKKVIILTIVMSLFAGNISYVENVIGRDLNEIESVEVCGRNAEDIPFII